MAMSNRIRTFLFLLALPGIISLSSCSSVNVIPPEVNLMRVDVQDITLSHVNLLADIRIFNPNDDAITIQGVDYVLHLEGVKLFSGRSIMAQTIAPEEYGHLSLRLSSTYWDIIQLLNKLPDKADVAFSMEGSIRVGKTGLFARRISFRREGMIPLQQIQP
jgi:LEA14-like dessication related protein